MSTNTSKALSEFSLEGKVAIVTGASRGIGKAISLVFAEAGADIVAAARSAEDLEKTAAEVKALGRQCLVVPTDITKADQVQGMAESALKQFGKIDILVNNAGIATIKPLVPLPGYIPPAGREMPNFFSPITDEEWHRLMNTNLVGAFYCCRAVGPYMLERRKGKVISISSVQGIRPFLYHTLYNTAKAALEMFTRSLALEWGRYGINVNAIAPGHVYTDMSKRDHDSPVYRERLLKLIPMKRVGELREVGLLAVYLASEASNYITGQTLRLDGGETAT
ncbi:MAG: 3-oxoacyl-ACP reductase FabG [Chloroflexi bacterium]|nr:3-oxoacyl-ACP reductase FabG [Chloroflexota bacterium]